MMGSGTIVNALGTHISVGRTGRRAGEALIVALMLLLVFLLPTPFPSFSHVSQPGPTVGPGAALDRPVAFKKPPGLVGIPPPGRMTGHCRESPDRHGRR